MDALLFVISPTRSILNDGELAVLDLDTQEVKRLGVTGVSPRYVETGHILYATEDGSVNGVPLTRLDITGTPVPLVEAVMVRRSGAASVVSQK